jgi:hypothetical protein
MFDRKKGALSFNHSIHNSFFQATSNCSVGEGLVGNILKRFGDLDCIFCLSSGNKIDSMTDVGRGKLFE